MKKIFITIIALSMFVFCQSGCSNDSNTENLGDQQTLLKATKINPSAITKIVVYDGRGGLNKPLTIENKQEIEQFITEYLDKCVVAKIETMSDEMLTTGWSHDIVFYSGNKKIMDIMFSKHIVLNKTDNYKVLKNDLAPNKIDEFLKSVDSSWKTP